MPTLLDIVYPWPVVSVLVSHLGIADLLNLSRVNTKFRAVLHALPLPSPDSNSALIGIETQLIRPDIYLGQHRTHYWTSLKTLAQKNCAEQAHRKGTKADLCRHCSMPVCEACIVRESFAQSTSAFRTRIRYLCKDCWNEGIPRRGRSYTKPPHSLMVYNFPPGEGDFCRCTVKDGWICAKCRSIQCADIDLQRQQCFGDGCDEILGPDKENRMICLWCDYPIAGLLSRAGLWQGYDQRCLVSSSISPYSVDNQPRTLPPPVFSPL